MRLIVDALPVIPVPMLIADRMAEAERLGRKATLLNPIEEDETAQVLRRRLFESVDDGAAREAVAACRPFGRRSATPSRPMRAAPRPPRVS